MTSLRSRRSPLYPTRDVWLLLPGLAGFALFYAVPLALSVRYSMWQSSFSHVFVGLENYCALFQNSMFLLALKNSLVFALLMPLLILPLALGTAALLRRYPDMRFLQFIYLLPVFLPSAGIAAMWKLIFSDASPLAAALNFRNGAFQETLNMEWLALLVLSVWKNLGIPLSIVLGAMTMLNPACEEAAALDGAGAWKCFTRVTLPQLRPALLYALVYIVMCSQRLFRECYLLYGAYPSRAVYLMQHYMNAQFSKLNYHVLSAAAITQTLIILLPMLVYGIVHAHGEREV